MMVKKVLVANRGEVAVRIIRACRAMEIETVAIYSAADADELHVHLADDAVCVGGAAAQGSYLNMENILSAALNTGCEAIHPGYGFLSENSRFVKLCESVGLTFVGPSAEVIAKMGDKSTAKKLMKAAGVPLVPGSAEEVELEEGKQLAESIGFPVLIKASAGGGGRGMRIVRKVEDFESAFQAARYEAEAAFGHGGVYLEKYVENPRHIEVQILADEYGNTLHLGERDCSIQRRNQKIIEEAPAILPDALKERMYEAAIRAATHVGYTNAGTVEFIVEGESFYFIEMNTRLQVEHPVTEAITGVDLVREQLRIASGESLAFDQEAVTFNGHAIEARINAEEPREKFRPAPGRVSFLHLPQGPGIRFDSLLYTDGDIQPHYDSMVGKLIVRGDDRADAIQRMSSALDELIIAGEGALRTNRPFLSMLMLQREFKDNEIDTGFVERHLERLLSYES